MNSSTDYETLAALKELRQTITQLNDESQKRLTSAQEIYSEIQGIKSGVQSQLETSKELALQLISNRKLIDEDFQRLSSETEILTTQITQAKDISLQIESMRQYVKTEFSQIKSFSDGLQTRVNEFNDFSSNHLEKSQNNLDSVEKIAEKVELSTSNIDIQYQQFLEKSEDIKILKTELSLLQDQYSNLAVRHKYTSLGFGGGLFVSILCAIFL